MSECTPEEISRKRKIAEERLRQFKQRRLNESNSIPANSSSSVKLPATANGAETSEASTKDTVSSGKDMPVTKIYTPNFIGIVTCTCCMVSEHRFGVFMSEYHQKAIDVCKTIPTRSYDPAKRLWTFDLKDYDLVRERLGALKPNIVTNEIPKSIIKLCTTISDDNDGAASSYMASITDTLVNALLPFQKDGVIFGIRKQGRVLIADEMGLGKTIQALAIADFYKEDWPLFIATTATTRDHWVAEIQKFLPHVNCQHIACITASHEYFEDAKIVICSYPMMEKCLDKFELMNFGVLIMDESHMLKSSKAKCTKVAEKLAKKANRVILLSGTPALSRPLELFSQLKMLDKKFLSFMDYTLRYCNGKSSAFGWDASGQSNLEELNVILTKKFMIRRVKADVLPDLAMKFRETVQLDSSLITHNSLLNKYATQFSQNYGRARDEILLYYYAETAAVKTAAVCSYLKGLVKEDKKFIVFAHHKVMMNAICECLSELRVGHIRIDGSTQNSLRTRYVNKFQNKTECRVAVLSLKACNTGITLTAAQLIVFAELDWNPSTLSQAESRAHRIGQEGKVTCRYLMARDTADDIIWNILQSKQNVLNKAGLFADDLRENEHIPGPSSTGDIRKFLVKTPQKTNSTFSTSQTTPSKADESFEDLLNDGEDDDLANLEY